MQSNEYAEIVVDLTPDLPLADVIQLPQPELGSFYTRNSAALPRLGGGSAGRYRRESLPSPVEPEPDTALNRLREFVSKNRPAWLPQR